MNQWPTLKPPQVEYPEAAIEVVKRICNGEGIPHDQAFAAIQDAKKYQQAICDHHCDVLGAIQFAELVFWGHPIETFHQYQVSSQSADDADLSQRFIAGKASMVWPCKGRRYR